MRNKLLALICCIMLITTNLSAQNRWRLATTGKDVEVYYDRGGISHTPKGTVKVWIKYEYTKEVSYVKQSVSLMEYQCADRISRTLSETDYKQTGEVIASMTPHTPRWNYVIPDTIDEALFEIVCKGRKDLQLKSDEDEEIETAKWRTLNLVEKYIKQGQKYQKTGRNIDAIKAFRQALQLDPTDAFPHYCLGEVYVDLKNYPEAIKEFQQSIRTDPKFYGSYISLAELLKKLSRHSEAIEVYKQAIQKTEEEAENDSLLQGVDEILEAPILPYYSSLYYGLGRLYEELNRNADAIELYKQQIHAFPNDKTGYIHLADVQEKLSLNAEVVETYKQAINLLPEDCELHVYLGDSYEKNGNFIEAAKSYEQAITITLRKTSGDNDCRAIDLLYSKLGSIYSKLKQYPKAIESLNQAISINSKTGYFYSELGDVYKQAGQYNEAISTYRLAINRFPDSSGTYLGLGGVFEELEQYGDALLAYNKAISLNVKNRRAHIALGRVYLKVGDKDAAIEEYKKLKLIDEKAANELYKLIYK
ncbi:MAG TPA: surface-adhesin E family protein [Pyrinomonadaceae bacterium]|nr:surface-adhesin E family protein [Pyrinomonadaceae bacterium]